MTYTCKDKRKNTFDRGVLKNCAGLSFRRLCRAQTVPVGFCKATSILSPGSFVTYS